MPAGETTDLKFAFTDLIVRRLRDNPRCFFIGFDVSRHQLDVPGAMHRICDMPIAEESMLGIATGMSRAGSEVFVDLMFEAFAFRTMDVLVNQAAISALLPSVQRAPIIVRMICGPFTGAGPQHGGAGYALLARLPDILVAAPSTATDLSVAYNATKERGKPLLLLFGGDGVASGLTEEEETGIALVHRLGMGTRLAVVSWGLHSSIVQQAVTAAGASGFTQILIPLFLAPLPTDVLLKMAGDAEKVLIVDGSPPPATLGDLLAAEASRLDFTRSITRCSLWEHGVGAQHNREACILSLANVISELVHPSGAMERE